MSEHDRRRPRPDNPRAGQPDLYGPPSPYGREWTSDGEMPRAVAQNFWVPCSVCGDAIEPGEVATLTPMGTHWYHQACAIRPTLTVHDGPGRDAQATLPLLSVIPGERVHGYAPGRKPSTWLDDPGAS